MLGGIRGGLTSLHPQLERFDFIQTLILMIPPILPFVIIMVRYFYDAIVLCWNNPVSLKTEDVLI